MFVEKKKDFIIDKNVNNYALLSTPDHYYKNYHSNLCVYFSKKQDKTFVLVKTMGDLMINFA